MNLTTHTVEFKGNGSMCPGYLAVPEVDESVPGVVVIQDKDVTRRMAAEGFVALAPDLYRGVATKEPDEARKLAMELDRERAIKDIQGAVNFLVAREDVVPKKIGIIGFCMGGGMASWMSYVGKDVGAVAVFYGGRSALDDETAAKVSAPFLGIYGELDTGIPLELVHGNEALLKKHNKICEFHIYPDAPHAFFNDTRDVYRESAADDAWHRTLTWFRKYLVE
jgi:carboxymethylenebutenolidase